MKRIRRILFLAIAVTAGILVLFEGEIEAADYDFYKSYTVQSDRDEEFTLKSKCKLTIVMEAYGHDDDNDWEDEWHDNEWEDDDWEEEGFVVEIVNDEWDSVFEEFLIEDGIYRKTLTLPAGYYKVYMEGDEKCTLTLSGVYLPELSSDDITLEAGKKKTLKVKGGSKKVTWKSQNQRVATVSGKGVVKAKKAGKTTITAKCDGYKLKCRVTVTKKPATYKSLARNMKEFARKNGDFIYKDVDVGKKCRIYALTIAGYDDSKIYSERYIVLGIFQPYIELVNKKGKPVLSLRMGGYLEKNSTKSTSLYCDELFMFTSNRRMKFKMKHLSGRNFFDYSYYLYNGSMKGVAELSTSSLVKESDLKKIETMTGQNSLALRIKSTDGASFKKRITNSVRNNWKKLVREYRILLKEY